VFSLFTQRTIHPWLVAHPSGGALPTNFPCFQNPHKGHSFHHLKFYIHNHTGHVSKWARLNGYLVVVATH